MQVRILSRALRARMMLAHGSDAHTLAEVWSVSRFRAKYMNQWPMIAPTRPKGITLMMISGCRYERSGIASKA